MPSVSGENGPLIAFSAPVSSHTIMNTTSGLWVDAGYLQESLRQGRHNLLILDCRSVPEYMNGRIRNGINVALPSLMQRRLLSGKLALSLVLPYLPSDAADMLRAGVPIVLYDNDRPVEEPTSNSFMTALCKKLLNEGYNVHCLKGGFQTFEHLYPEWCETTVQAPPIVGLTSLRISPIDAHGDAGSNVGPGCLPGQAPLGACDSSLGRETPLDDLCFPVEILPHLFLGNAQNSCDREALNRHKIKYIVNVTQNLPNVFEASGTYKYMQIPISDHWSQNLASFFPKAIQFIDEARENGVGVLVHCLAGISRSVTITVAYLMYKEKLSLEDAYEYVRVKKANIAPNFNFMGQLQDFQQQLNLQPHKCQCMAEECRCKLYHFMTPTSTRTSPDSGIEFDRFS